MKHYNTVIYGASAKGIGIASQMPENCLIVESSCLAAREFIDALAVGTGSWEPVSEQGERMVSRYKGKKIMMEGKPIQIAAAAPVIFELIRDCGIHILFGTEMDLSRAKKEKTFTCYNSSGLQSVCADHFYSWEQEVSQAGQYRKYINALIYCGKPDIRLEWENGMEGIWTADYSFPDMKILSCRLEAEDDWITARKKIHTFWMHRPAPLQQWEIASVASTFAWMEAVANGKEGKAALRPMYENMLMAFEDGVRLGRKWRDEKCF